MAAYRRVYDSRHLQADWMTAKHPDQLRNTTLGNRVQATLTFYDPVTVLPNVNGRC